MFETHCGVCFYPFEPRAEDILAEDLAFALAHQNRYAGHAGTYSVAEHCWRVAHLLKQWGEDAQTQLAGLLHDAAEAYLVDLPRPVKEHLLSVGQTAYDEAEAKILSCVEKAFLLSPGACSSAVVELADNVMLATERRDLFPGRPAWDLPAACSMTITPWSPEESRACFKGALYGLLEQNDDG